jgi:hypothetical protein
MSTTVYMIETVDRDMGPRGRPLLYLNEDDARARQRIIQAHTLDPTTTSTRLLVIELPERVSLNDHYPVVKEIG